MQSTTLFLADEAYRLSQENMRMKAENEQQRVENAEQRIMIASLSKEVKRLQAALQGGERGGKDPQAMGSDERRHRSDQWLKELGLK